VRALLAALILAVSPVPSPALPADVDVGFSDLATSETLVVSALNGASRTVAVAIYSLNEPGIVTALLNARQRGVRVSVKYDVGQAKQPAMQAALSTLAASGVLTLPIRMKGWSYMHHKFAVIDGSTVVTGSFNFTRNATKHNWENVAVIRSETIARLYAGEWDRIVSR